MPDFYRKKTDNELLDMILGSPDASPASKARAVLVIREKKTLSLHNKLMILLTLIVALATTCQGIDSLHDLRTEMGRPAPQTLAPHTGCQ